MGGKKKRNRTAGRIALEGQESLAADQAAAQEMYDADLEALRGASDVTDYYQDLQFSAIDPQQMQLAQTERAQLGELGPAQQATAQGYTAAQTDVAGLARGADTGLSNVFNNLQVSTAGADLAAQEADQSLAASQEAMMMMGGGGGATALASQAAKSKAGISADIDRQVKANEMARAQGEQSLQRDLLAQGNLASQFDLNQAQTNVAATNQASQFGAAAQNQASMFNAGQANNMALSKFGAENQMNQFNANAANNAFANQANAVNNAVAQNASMQNEFNMNKAAGQSQAQSNKYDALMGIYEISSNQLNDADRAAGENQAVIDQARMSGMNKDGSYTRKWWEKGGIALATGALGLGAVLATGGTGAPAVGAAMFSDRRLKKDIKLVGLSPSGLKIYNFKYKDTSFGKGTFQGVMSDEIPANAITKNKDGYDLVDYNKLDVEFKLINI